MFVLPGRTEARHPIAHSAWVDLLGGGIRSYGAFCNSLKARGINLSDLDMMNAAHAVAVDATLVSRDKAFAQVAKPLKLEVW